MHHNYLSLLNKHIQAKGLSDSIMEDKKSFIKRELAYNGEVQNNLKTLRDDIKLCNSAAEMLEKIDSYPIDLNLKYKNKAFWFFILISALLAVAIFFTFPILPSSEASLYFYLIPFATLIVAFIFKKNDTERQSLIAYIEDFYIQKKYNFKNHTGQEKIPHDTILKNYAALFKKGNYKNDIPYYASGSLEHEKRQLPYTIFQYHYIDKRKETYRENGKTKTRIVYDHFDNWGIFISDVECPSFSITNYANNHFPQLWTTSSIDFNKKHSITGANEIELAKIMQPANVLVFEKLLGQHSSFELTCNNAIPTLCWNFNWDILQRKNNSPSYCATAKQLNGHLSGISLPEYEVLIKELKPLLDKMVK